MKSTRPVRICVPICVSRAGELSKSVARAAEVADLIELRLDCLESAELDEALRGVLPELLRATGARPAILTLRPIGQGGARRLDDAARYRFWSEFAPRSGSDFADIELDLALDLMTREPPQRDQPHRWHQTICSHHDFVGVPVDLEEIYERMASTPARILKIAVQANSITDCIPVFHLLERARREGREMIAVAMGEAGIATRLLGPARGAFLTYGALDETHATAPGQLTAAALRDVYRIEEINEQTEIMGLVGSPVAHSFSPQIHNAAYAATGLNAVYLPFAVRCVGEFIKRMAHPHTREIDWKLRGLSITAPHKSSIIEYLDWIDPAAREIGAVNTVVIDDDALRGYNTDAAAALAPLKELIELRDARVAVIGAGGAARAVLWSLKRAGAHVTIFARATGSTDRARQMADDFGARRAPLDGAQFGEFDVVINTTPLGTRGSREDDTPATSAQLRGADVVYDLVYNPCETRLMREARAAGCPQTAGGLAMLVAQAAAQFSLWTGRTAPLGVMRAAAERQISDAGR